tara:strand:+ start:305 stop:460 length:156 start_codon:yes stop_codon:yes gene_type:complete
MDSHHINFNDINKIKENNNYCIVSDASKEIMLDRLSVSDEVEFPFCNSKTS